MAASRHPAASDAIGVGHGPLRGVDIPAQQRALEAAQQKSVSADLQPGRRLAQLRTVQNTPGKFVESVSPVPVKPLVGGGRSGYPQAGEFRSLLAAGNISACLPTV